LLRCFGEDHYQKGGECLCYIPEKKLRLLRDALDKMGNIAMVKSETEKIITAMHMDRRINRTQLVA